MKHILFIALLFSVTSIGCTPKNPFGTVPVSGTVTLDGVLAAGVNIRFIPVSPNNLEAYGTTQADGSFVLTTGGAAYGCGAQPGMYEVTFNKTDIEEKYKNPIVEMTLERQVVIPPLIYIVPQRYNDPKTSGMDPVGVEKGKKNTFQFKLSGS